MLDPHHEDVTKTPQQHILERDPAQERGKAEHAPDILGVLDVAKGKLCHPRDLLPESIAVVGARLAKQLVHPEKKQKVSGGQEQLTKQPLYNDEVKWINIEYTVLLVTGL